MRSLVFEGGPGSVTKTSADKDRVCITSLCQMLKEMLRGNPATGLGKQSL